MIWVVGMVAYCLYQVIFFFTYLKSKLIIKNLQCYCPLKIFYYSKTNWHLINPVNPDFIKRDDSYFEIMTPIELYQ